MSPAVQGELLATSSNHCTYEFYASSLADKCIRFSGTRIVYCRERAFDTESDTYHNLGTSTMTKALPTTVPF